jgi:hypothetical protein
VPEKPTAGSPTREDLEEKACFLRKELEADDCRPSGEGWLFARYNKDSWPRGPFRRNDLLIPLEVHRRLPPAMLHVHIWHPACMIDAKQHQSGIASSRQQRVARPSDLSIRWHI